jgi:hypothetical protein
MKKVAIVGADFAPSSLPNAQRIRFLASHLAEFGWEPIVVTVHPRHYESTIDLANERLLPDNLKVLRTSAFPVKWTRKLGLGDIGMRSLWFHWRALARLCRQKQLDMVFISLLPGISSVLGRLIYAQFKVPYVIDYQDPWVTNYYWSVPKEQRPPKWPLVYAMASTLEPFALKNVSCITGVSKGTTDGVVEHYPWLSNICTAEIPLGGEPADYVYLRKHPRSNPIFNREDGLLHISSVGRGGVDTLPVLRTIFEAIQIGRQISPELFSRLRLHFVGTTYAPNAKDNYQVMPLAHEMGVADYVDEHPGRVAYLDSLQILLDSHGLLAVGSILSHYTASKIFPYIMSSRPLLAIFHKASSVIDIVHDAGAGQTVAFADEADLSTKASQIAAQLETLLSLPTTYQPPTKWEAVEAYTGRAMAHRLAGVFDNIVNKE